jgi:hypothetical protein
LDEDGIASRKAAGSFADLCQREGITCFRADIEREPLPLESNSVDAVLFTEVIEHLWLDPLFALSEVNRVLKTGTGILLLSTPNLTNLRNRLNFLRGNIAAVIEHPFVAFLKAKRVGHLGHCRLYAPSELATMLSLLGFEPTVLFTRYLDAAGETPSEPMASAATPGPTPGDGRPRQPRKSVLRKLLRSPRNYWAAGCATALAVLESWIPRFRPQVFLVARKVTNADFDRNYPRETHQLIMTNTVSV